MEGILGFVSVVIIVFGILQIILFFKLWGMTNRVASIENKLINQSHSYEFYMISGENEKAFARAKNYLINRLIGLRSVTYNDKRFKELANSEIPTYIKMMKATGFEVPKHLLSAEAFIEYQDNINNL